MATAGEKNVTFRRTARLILASYLATFLLARIIVLLIMTRRMPDLYLYLGETHVHHFNYGVFLLVAVGAYLLLRGSHTPPPKAAIIAYGIGLALTFDEFGMWFHLGGLYWQRASFDAVAITAAAIALIAYAPAIKQFRARHWIVTVLLLVAMMILALLFNEVVRSGERLIGPRMRQIEADAPR